MAPPVKAKTIADGAASPARLEGGVTTSPVGPTPSGVVGLAPLKSDPATSSVPALSKPADAGAARMEINAGGAPGQQFVATHGGRKLVLVVRGTATHAAGQGEVLNATVRLPASLYGKLERVDKGIKEVVLKLAIPPAATPEQSAQLIADAINLDIAGETHVVGRASGPTSSPPAKRLRATVRGARVTVDVVNVDLTLEPISLAPDAAATRRLAAAEAGNSGPAAKPTRERPWTGSSAGELDGNTQRLLECLDKRSEGFSRGVHHVFTNAVPACTATPVERVNIVGRALGSEHLRLPSDTRVAGELQRDSGAVRRLVAMTLPAEPAGVDKEAGRSAFVGFTPNLDAKGNASQFGTYEVIVERERPNSRGEYTDFFVMRSAPAGVSAPTQNTTLCVSCHQAGLPIFAVDPWREVEGVGSPIVARKVPALPGVPTPAQRLSSARDLPLTEAYNFDERVRRAAGDLARKRWAHYAGLTSYDARVAIVGQIFASPNQPIEEAHPSVGRRRETFRLAADRLNERRTSDPVRLMPGSDPLARRDGSEASGGEGSIGLPTLAEAAQVLWGGAIVGPHGTAPMAQLVKELIAPKTWQEFLGSQALATELITHWPPRPRDLVSAAEQFRRDPRPADNERSQRLVDVQARQWNARIAEERAGNAIRQTSSPTDPAGIIYRYCYECHHDGGLVPVLDPNDLTRQGKYPDSRTIQKMIESRLMPPRPMDSRLLKPLWEAAKNSRQPEGTAKP
jgi:hypothetical protein